MEKNKEYAKENKLKSKTISIKDAEKLYKILPKKFREEFIIGMHGFIINSKF